MKPIRYRWDGEVMRPVGAYFKDLAAFQYESGTCYDLAETEHRSRRMHNAFFLAVDRAWDNLRERGDADLFPSPTHLRKWALTFTPFCEVKSYPARTGKERDRFIRFARGEYSRIVIHEGTNEVWCYRAMSQREDQMSARQFRASFDAVIDVLAQRLGVTPQELWEAGKNAA